MFGSGTRRKRRRTGDEDYSTESDLYAEPMEECGTIVDELMQQRCAEAFLEPVDWKGLNLVTYPRIVKKPMDLGTIKKLLEANAFESPEHFAIHVRLVFSNALLFNARNSPIGHAAVFLNDMFEKSYGALVERWLPGAEASGTNDVAPAPKRRRKASNATVADSELKGHIAQLRQAILGMEKTVNGIKAMYQTKKKKLKRITFTKPQKPFTYKEKEKLCHLIEKLHPDDLPGLLAVTNQDQNKPEAEVVIDMEVMDVWTLVKLQKYVQHCLKHNQASKATAAAAGSVKKGSGTATTDVVEALEDQIQNIKEQQYIDASH